MPGVAHACEGLGCVVDAEVNRLVYPLPDFCDVAHGSRVQMGSEKLTKKLTKPTQFHVN